MNRALLASGLIVVLAVLGAGCSDSDSVVGGTSLGQVTVNIHDQAAPTIAEAHVTFSALALRDAQSGEWVEVPMEAPVTVDLLQLQGGIEATLASAGVPEGDYDAMQVTIVAAQVVLTDGTVVDLPVPAAPIAVTGFAPVTVESTGALTVTLDFPVDPSFQVSGTSVSFAPVITHDTAAP